MDHVIPLIYDVTQRNWVTSVGGSVVQDPIEIGQMQSITFKVKFVKDGVQYALTTPTFSGGIKALNAVGAGYLLQFSTPTVSGSGPTTAYSFELLIDSSQLRAFIASYLPSYLGFSYALEIRDSFNNIATLPALSTKIYPDYTIVGTSPTTAVGTWNIAAGQTFTVNKTFAMPADDGTVGFVLRTDGNGVGTWVANTLGSVTSVAQSFTGGIVSVGGSPVTSSGTLALTIAGTSGGIPYFSSGTTWATSAALLANSLVKGGGAGNPPSTITTGTGVLTALGNTTNATGGIVTFSGNVGATTATSVNGNTVTAGTGTLTLGVNTINLAVGTGANTQGGSINLSGGTGVHIGSTASGGSINLSGGTDTIGGDAYGGSIDLSGGVGSNNYGGNIDLSGGTGHSNGGNYGGNINLSGGASGWDNSGGSINLSGGATTSTGHSNYGGSINLSGGADGEYNNGGSIDLSGTSTGSNGVGGSINCSSSGDSGIGGSINLSSSGGIGSTSNGGSINLSSNTINSGGSINASNGGGSIDTTGTGSIGFGVVATRTTLVGSATMARTVTLPNATTTLAGLGIAQTFSAAQTFSSTVSLTLGTDATSSAAGAVMISGGLAVAKKLYVGTTLFLSNGHRVTFFTSTTTTSQPTLYGVDGGGGQGTITFGSFGADGTTSLYGGISGAPASINCYKAELNCSYVTLAPSGGLKDSGGNIALTVTSNKQIAMGGTLAVTGTTTLTGLLTANGGVTIASGQALKLGNAATTGLTPGVLAATTNATLTITDSTGQVYRIPCII